MFTSYRCVLASGVGPVLSFRRLYLYVWARTGAFAYAGVCTHIVSLACVLRSWHWGYKCKLSCSAGVVLVFFFCLFVLIASRNQTQGLMSVQ